MDKTIEKDYEHAQQGAVLFRLADHRLLRVTGPDAPRYLQGRLTQDILGLEPGEAADALMLTPQGKVEAKLTVLRESDSFLLICDPAPRGTAHDELQRALLRFKVADAVEVEDLQNTHLLMTVQGPRSEVFLGACTGQSLPERRYGHAQQSIEGRPVTLMRHPRVADSGFDLITAIKDMAVVASELFGVGVVAGTLEGFKLLRIIRGVPEGGAELTEKTTATDVPVDDLVSFKKGCYAGQETVEMSISRGRPARRLVQLTAKASAAPEEGAEIVDSARGSRCGVITSSALLPGGNEALALGFIKAATPDDAPLVVGELQMVRTPLQLYRS